MLLQQSVHDQMSRGRIRVHKWNSESRLGELSALNGRDSAFTLVEVMMGVAVMGIMLVTLYGGFTFAFAETRLSRENVRATQILQEKMEIVRLYTWDQAVNTPGYMPTNFTEAFYSNNPTNTSTANFNYSGQVFLTAAPVSETYSGDLRMVQIKVSWKSGGITRNRQMSTFISQYGLQKYVY
jgi:prepilin-type N-terminal cleavage/methylation domain-containing protein